MAQVTLVKKAAVDALAERVEELEENPGGPGPGGEAFTSAEKSKLIAIQAEATKNQPDSYLLERANHTGTIAISVVQGLAGELAGKQPTENGKGLSEANFTSAEKTKLGALPINADLQAALSGKVDKVDGNRLITPEEGDRIAAQPEDFDAAVNDLIAELKADPNGIAPVVNGLIPTIYLPNAIEEILSFANVAGFPATGEPDKIYVDQSDENQQYRWTGSAYIPIASSPGTTDEVAEGASNKYFTPARVLAAPLTGFASASTNRNIVATDSVVDAFGVVERRLTDLGNSKVSVSAVRNDLTNTSTPNTPLDSRQGKVLDDKITAVDNKVNGLIPSQSGQAGKVLGTNGTTVGWVSPPTGGTALPTQTGQAGKVLTTDGTNPSWSDVSGTIDLYVNENLFTGDGKTASTPLDINYDHLASQLPAPEPTVVDVYPEAVREARLRGSRVTALSVHPDALMGSSNQPMDSGVMYVARLVLDITSAQVGIGTLCTHTSTNVSGDYTASDFNGAGLFTVDPVTGNFTRIALTANDGDFWKTPPNVWKWTPFAGGNMTLGKGLYFLAMLHNASAVVAKPQLVVSTAARNFEHLRMGGASVIPPFFTVPGQLAIPSAFNISAASPIPSKITGALYN